MGGIGSGGDRRSKSKALRALHGSKTRARHRTQPAADPAVPDMPDDLNADGQEAWRYYAPLLGRMRVLTEADRDALAAYCDALAQLSEITRLQRAPDYRRVLLYTMPMADGSERPKVETNPLDAQRRQWTVIARQLRSDLGLSPATRARVAAVPADEGKGDPFAQFDVVQGGKP